MNKLKLGDEVIVLAGKDKGKTGKVKSISTKRNRVLVDGVNLAKKAMRPSQANPTGGIESVERSVHRSNIAIVSPKTKKGTRVRIETKDGKKVRVAVACGSVLS